MSIPFPKMHIAASAINRILNAVEGEKTFGLSEPQMISPPDIADPATDGAVLDAKLQQPPVPADVPPGQAQATDQNMLANSALGGSPFDGALVGLAASP